jgi:hypothetical protein
MQVGFHEAFSQSRFSIIMSSMGRERYQTKDRVRFEEPLKSMSACSWMVNTRELERDELQTVSCARIPVNIVATQKLPAYLMLGMGFETEIKSGYCGVINQLEPVRRYCLHPLLPLRLLPLRIWLTTDSELDASSL